jgi:transcriptional regulator with XRE-family HTH domain
VDTPTKSEFAKMCRALRVENGLKQREVASAIGVAVSTYGNVECSPWKVVGSQKVAKMVKLYSLDQERASALLSAWEQVPLSPYGERVRHKWQKRNALRSKAKHHDLLEFAMIDLIFWAVQFTPDDQMCICGFDGKVPESDHPCELCEALAALGLGAYSSRDRLTTDLVKLHAKLEAASAAKAVAGAAP